MECMVLPKIPLPQTPLQPPFTESDSVFDSAQSIQITPSTRLNNNDSTQVHREIIVLPATYRSDSDKLLPLKSSDPISLSAYLHKELNVHQLNRIHSRLDWAGSNSPAQPLHAQIHDAKRAIAITEDTNRHLIYKSKRIWIKPLPDFLLCHDIWRDHLCPRIELYEYAAGLLLSYIWLVSRPSDLRIAHQHGLISSSVMWAQWTAISRAVMSRLEQRTLPYNRRYEYGQLRQEIVEVIDPNRVHYRSLGLVKSFIFKNLIWFTAPVLYVVLILTAMQVGLATTRLKNSSVFQAWSFGFTVFAIVSPLVVMALDLLIVIVLVVYRAVIFRSFMLSESGRKKKESDAVTP